jgi:hypothetical protein
MLAVQLADKADRKFVSQSGFVLKSNMVDENRN